MEKQGVKRQVIFILLIKIKVESIFSDIARLRMFWQMKIQIPSFKSYFQASSLKETRNSLVYTFSTFKESQFGLLLSQDYSATLTEIEITTVLQPTQWLHQTQAVQDNVTIARTAQVLEEKGENTNGCVELGISEKAVLCLGRSTKKPDSIMVQWMLK